MQYYVRTTQSVPTDSSRYITVGKCYPISSREKDSHYIIGDQGRPLFILLRECTHLDGRDWEIVSQEEIDNMNKTTQQRQLEEAQQNLTKAQEQLESLQESMKQESLWSHDGTGEFRTVFNGLKYISLYDIHKCDHEKPLRFNTEEEADIVAQDLQNTLILSQLAAFCNKGVDPDECGWRWNVYFVVSRNKWGRTCYRDVKHLSVSFNSEAAADKACEILNSQDLGIVV